MISWKIPGTFLLATLLLWTGANARGGMGVPYVAPSGTSAISVSSQPGPFPQAITANNWTGFTSQAGSVFQNNNWTSPPTTFSYLTGNDFTRLVARTIATPKDVEVTTYVRDGTTFLRMSGGSAVYCRFNAEASAANGSFEIGIVTGAADFGVIFNGSSFVGSYYALYTNSDMFHSVPGYDSANTAGSQLTCGVSGLTIYGKFNGTTFASVTSNLVTGAGSVGLWANTGYGYRDVTVNYLPTPQLYSMRDVSRWDPRDWGAKQGHTTGSITAGGNTLTLANDIGLLVGDSVIVAVGGEAGGGARGTVGVGGDSPTLSFANTTARDADTAEPDGTFGWTRNDGKAYISFSGAWSLFNTYYNDHAAPRALLANVTAVGSGGTSITLDTNASFTGSISGKTLTISSAVSGGSVRAGQLLAGGGGGGAAAFTHIVGCSSSTSCTVDISQTVGSGAMTATGVIASTTNANVYPNSFAAYSNMLNPSLTTFYNQYQTFDIPFGITTIGAPMGTSYTDPISITNKNNWRVFGKGLGSVIMSPDGTTSAGIIRAQSHNTEVAYVSILGNNRANGFGYAWAGNTDFGTPRAMSMSVSNFAVAHDFASNDVFYAGVDSSFSFNATAYNCAITQSFATTAAQSTPDGEIEPWYIEWSDSIGGGVHDCTFTSPTVISALEMFRSNGVTFSRITMNNGIVSCNSCGGGFLYEDITTTINANQIGSISIFNPVININNNIIDVITTGSISGTTFTVTAANQNNIAVGDLLVSGGATPVTSGTTIVNQLSGTPGGIGTYTVNHSQTVGSETINIFNAGIAQGGTISRPTVIQPGLVDGTNMMTALSINANNVNVSVTGTYTSSSNGKGCFSAPNWATGINPFFAVAIRSDGPGASVSNVRIIGTADTGSGHSNIYVEGGDLVSTNNIMDSSLMGAGGKTESGTESNATWNAANPGHPGC